MARNQFFHIKALPVAALLIIFFLLVLTSVSTKSPICDEAGHHIAAGYSYVKTGDFRMNPAGPPLIRILMGFPLLFLDLKIPTDHPSWSSIASTDFSYQFLYVYNKDADKIVFLSRLPMILVSTLMGLIVFLWSKRFYGYKGAVFALFLYTFSPAILANAGLAMLDTSCAFFIFLAAFRFWVYIKEKTVFNAVLCGVCFGLAQSAKLTSLILYPIFLILAAADIVLCKKETRISLSLKLFKDISVICLTGFFVLWATYFFEFKPLLKNAPDLEEKIEYIKKFSKIVPFVDKDRFSGALIYFAKNIPIPLSAYLISISGIARSVAFGDQKLFFMGRNFMGGSKIYYTVLFLIRTPLPFIILLILSVFLFRKTKRIDTISGLFLIVPIAVIFTAVSFSKLQGGIRYILPVYPFLFVLMGGLVTVNANSIVRGAKGIFYILCAWYAVSSVAAFPHYIAYFNELTGGPDGFGYRITSDADWGQDFKELKKYIDKNNIKSIKLLCFGSSSPEYYGIPYEEFQERENMSPIAGKYYAISSRFLPKIKWADQYAPIDKVAHNIFIYYIIDEKNETKK